MGKTFNVAILGAGGIARAMATAVNGLGGDYCLYAVASRSLEKAQAFAEKWGVKVAYGSYEELAADEAVDLIYVATPHSEHFANAKLCIEHGRNCLVEKAFCANLKQTRELIKLAREKKVLLAEAMWTRYQPSKDIIRGILNSGRLGNLHYLESDFSISARGVERLEKPELCGGALLDLGVYSLTVPAMYFGNDVIRIKSSCEKNEYGVDLTDEITLVYKNKNMAKVKCSFGLPNSNYAKIVGDKGYIVFGPINVPTYYEIFDINGKSVERKDIPLIVNGYEYEVMECKAAIEAGKTEPESMPHAETERLMGWMDSLRNHFGVEYPFEAAADRTHADTDVWGNPDVYDDVNPWDRRNTASKLEIFNIEDGTREVIAEFDKVIEAPNWSHDGKFLIFNSEGLVYKFDLETKQTTQIPSGKLCKINNDHVLSADDLELSVSDETEGSSRIYSISLENGDVSLITKQAPSYLHGQTPDRKTYCYCACRDGEYDVYAIDRGSDTEKRLTDAPCLNDGCEYDSKGEYIYFNSVRAGLMQAFRMKADGSEQTQLTFDSDLNTWFPHISPDNSKIVMVSYYKGDLWPGEHIPNRFVELRLMNADCTELKTIAKVFGGQGTINVNSWAPDSRRFAFVSYEKK